MVINLIAIMVILNIMLNMLNYARLMPVHLAQMHDLEEDNPETWNALKSAFVVAKSEIPFTHLFTDQALEQLGDKEAKGERWYGWTQ